MDEVDQYSLDSEENLSDGEKLILEKIRKGRAEGNFDSEDEVLGFDEEEDEDEENDDNGDMDIEDEDAHDSLESDIEDLEDDQDMPDEKAWGKKKKNYYSTDYVDPDYSSLNEKQKAIAKMEEEEARKIHKRLTEQLDDADFGLDMIVGKKEKTKDEDEEKEVVQVDLSKLGSKQKLQLLEKESPELLLLLNDYKDRLKEVRETIKPFLNIVANKGCEENAALLFLKTKYQLLRKYFINLSFYLMLKAKRLSTTSHPVIKRLAENRFWLAKFDEKQRQLYSEINKILEAHNRDEPMYCVESKSQDITTKRVKTKA